MPRIDGISKNLAKLKNLGELPFSQFKVGDPFDLAQHHLRLALEGIFHIGTHILSRLPGGRAVEYADIPKRLAEQGVLEPAFAEKKLVPMARLRNLLVHHYADIDAQEIYRIIHEDLEDIEYFLGCIKKVIENPGKLGLTVE